jgi:hypothetical protein
MTSGKNNSTSSDIDICVPRKILRDTPDLSYVQPEGNYYFKISDSYQILKSCSINISDCLKSPGNCDSSPCIEQQAKCTCLFQGSQGFPILRLFTMGQKVVSCFSNHIMQMTPLFNIIINFYNVIPMMIC